jgi:hypothetical protein
MRAASGWSRQVLAHTPFAKFFESRPSALPLLPHHRPESAVPPRCKTFQHRRRLAFPEVAEPAAQVGGGFGDHLGEADASGSARPFSNPLWEADDGLGGNAPPWFSLAWKAQSEKFPPPRLGPSAFLLVHFELESLREEARYALPHSLSRPFAGDVDIFVVSLAHEAVTAAL